jgi:DNA-binding transcriptional LysR family regulator
MSRDVKPVPVEGIRIEDTDTFLRIFGRSEMLPYTKRTTYASLFGKRDEDPEAQAYTTVITQLQRVAEFAIRLLPNRRPGQAGEVEDLFARLIDGDGGLQPTPLARALVKELELLQEVYANVGQRTAARLGTNRLPQMVRIGSGPNFAMHMLPYVLSAGGAAGIQNFQVEMANTADLLPRLNSGLLDFVIAYGSVNDIGVRQEGLPGLRIGFTSFRYSSNLVLAAHPLVKVMQANGDANGAYQGYSSYQDYLRSRQSQRVKKGTEKSPRCDELRPVNLDEIDFDRTGLDLVVTRSWDNAPGLVKFLNADSTARKRVRWVEGYDEAVALVKLRQGLAVLPQVFSKRRMVNAFRLTPEKAFTRWIGAYYSPRFPLSEEAYRLLDFIRAYLQKFALSLRNGRPAAYPEPEFVRWCAEVSRVDESWTEKAEKDYPLRLTKREGKKKSEDAD